MNIAHIATRCVGLLVVGLLALSTMAAYADTNSQVINWLATNDTYVTNVHIPGQVLGPGAYSRLNTAVNQASNAQLSEKLAILSHYPYPHFADIHAAADALVNTLQVDGLVLLVSPAFTTNGRHAPGGLGVGSSILTRSQELTIEARAAPRCRTAGYVSCLVYASTLAVAQARRDKNNAFHDAAVFWFGVLVVLGLVILALVLAAARRRRQSTQNLSDLRRAAYTTLDTADRSVEEIEAQSSALSPEARQAYDRALGLRNRARAEIDGAQSVAGLKQANEDAAQAVLAMQETMRRAGIENAATSPLDLGERRCFYCGRTDRPPYTTRTIEDRKGNSMEIEICAVDMETLQQGKTPQLATAQYQGSPVPWWAVPTNPWYYSYGGPSWQYWLPFMIGMDVGGWYGGGWGGFYGDGGGAFANDYDGGQGVIDPGQQGSQDMGAGDFTGWAGGDPGSGVPSSGDWSGDTSDWGGDTGAGDWGGDNSGGW